MTVSISGAKKEGKFIKYECSDMATCTQKSRNGVGRNLKKLVKELMTPSKAYSRNDIVKMGMLLVAFAGYYGQTDDTTFTKNAHTVVSDMFQYYSVRDKILHTISVARSVIWDRVFGPVYEKMFGTTEKLASA